MEGRTERLKVWAILSEETLNKFIAKFSGDHVVMTQSHNINSIMRTRNKL